MHKGKTHKVPSLDTLPWGRSAPRWYISHFDSVRLEGSFKKWRPVSLSVTWDHEALVAAHLPGKIYFPASHSNLEFSSAQVCVVYCGIECHCVEWCMTAISADAKKCLCNFVWNYKVSISAESWVRCFSSNALSQHDFYTYSIQSVLGSLLLEFNMLVITRCYFLQKLF